MPIIGHRMEDDMARRRQTPEQVLEIFKNSSYAWETTPYCERQVEGKDGWFVYQSWWNKDVAGPFATRDEAADEVIKEAFRRGCLKRVR